MRVSINGKLKFSSLPSKVKEEIKQKLAAKDPVMKRGLSGEFPGIKFNGKQVTKDNLHEFEITAKKKKPKTKPTETNFEDVATTGERKYYSVKELKDLFTVKKLKAFAKDLKIPKYSNMREAELCEALENKIEVKNGN